LNRIGTEVQKKIATGIEKKAKEDDGMIFGTFNPGDPWRKQIIDEIKKHATTVSHMTVPQLTPIMQAMLISEGFLSFSTLSEKLLSN